MQVLQTDRKEKYNRFVSTQSGIPLFYQPWWLDTVCKPEKWDIALSEDEGGTIRAIMPYFKTSLRRLPILRNPDLSPYQGIVFFYPDNLESRTSKYSFQNKHSTRLISQLPNKVCYMNFNFHPDFDNWYPFYWDNFEQSLRYTYILHDIGSVDQTFALSNNTNKRQIKKASELLKIKESEDIDQVFNLLSMSFDRQGKKMNFSASFLRKIYRVVKERKMGKILLAEDSQGRVHAGMLLVWDDRSAYCLVLGVDSVLRKSNAVKYLLWESIKVASNYVDTYNFEGSMIPNVERIFRAFGGERTAYYSISWFRNRFVKALWAFFK